jgi:IS30 family transposase
MKIDKQKLEQKIKEGKSSHDIAMTYDVHPSTIRRKAKQFGLKFETQSHWRKG